MDRKGIPLKGFFSFLQIILSRAFNNIPGKYWRHMMIIAGADI